MTEEFELAIQDLDRFVGKLARMYGDVHPEFVTIKELYLKMRSFLVTEDYAPAVEFLKEVKTVSNGFTLFSDEYEQLPRVYNAFLVIENGIM